MISPIPSYLALPVITLVAAITLARWVLLRESAVDRLINRSLSWAVVGLLLHERAVAPKIASLLHQLSLGSILFILAGIYGLAQLWGGADPTTTRQRQRRYDAATATVFALVLAAGTPARHQGLLIDQALGWPAVVFWAVFGAPLAVCAVLVLRVSIREFRTDNLATREKLVYYAIFAAAGGLLIDAIAGPLVAAFDTITAIPSSDPQMIRKAATFFVSTLAAALITAIPLATTVLALLDWDRAGRACRQLQPLWHDLTAAFPGLVLYPAAELAQIDTTVRLHRMTVEIRDVLLQLRPYLPNDAPDPRTGGRRAEAEYALHLATALNAKIQGAQPDSSLSKPAARGGDTTGDLDSELRSLLVVARDWPGAQARITAAPPVTLPPHQPSKEQTR
ncbi:MAB_1171c family putative transporter [Nocardia sp. NPDC004278]